MGTIKLSTIILVSLNIVLWGGFAFLGHSLAVGRQDRVGNSDLDQIEFLVVLPLLMIIVATVPIALFGQSRWTLLAKAFSVVTLFLLLPYGCVYGGGV